MIWWVYKQVKKVNEFSRVLVATDDNRIGEACEKLGIEYIFTSDKHQTSTERLYEVATKVEADFYVCVNGDEPLIDPNVIRTILPAEGFEIDNYVFFVRNLMTEIKDPVEVVDNTNIKVVTDSNGYAMYMSRSPIPYPKSSMNYKYYKHLGVLLYNYKALEFFYKTPKNKIELIEDINELRFIEHGINIEMIPVDANTLSVDTPKDLDKVREMITKGGIDI
jgi:3-deoxy-manno-octulosonate cytidylyltransferase (CMP-KDO synthetase)